VTRQFIADPGRLVRLEFPFFLLRDQAARVNLAACVLLNDSNSTGLERLNKNGVSRTSPCILAMIPRVASHLEIASRGNIFAVRRITSLPGGGGPWKPCVCLIRRPVLSAHASVTRRVQEERTCAFLLLQRRLLTRHAGHCLRLPINGRRNYVRDTARLLI
jgi:hypothetical protein